MFFVHFLKYSTCKRVHYKKKDLAIVLETASPRSGSCISLAPSEGLLAASYYGGRYGKSDSEAREKEKAKLTLEQATLGVTNPLAVHSNPS